MNVDQNVSALDGPKTNKTNNCREEAELCVIIGIKTQFVILNPSSSRWGKSRFFIGSLSRQTERSSLVGILNCIENQYG